MSRLMTPGPSAETCAFSWAQLASACLTNCAVEIVPCAAEGVDGVVVCLLLLPQAARPTLTRPASPIVPRVEVRMVSPWSEVSRASGWCWDVVASVGVGRGAVVGGAGDSLSSQWVSLAGVVVAR